MLNIVTRFSIQTWNTIYNKCILINTAWNGFCKGKSIVLPFF